MTPKEMQTKVGDELAQIPDWPGDEQNMLRMVYNALRRHSLGKKARERKTAKEILQESIAILKKTNPTVEVHYDKDFFERSDQ